MKAKLLLPIFLLAFCFQGFSESIKNPIESQNSLPTAYEDSKTLSNGRYIGGGAASILLGWGIGHAIQERYAEKGWIFTAGGALRAIGFSGFILSLLSSSIDLQKKFIKNHKDGLFEDGFPEFEMPGLSYFFLGAMVAGAGIKIWEMIDIWILPSSYKVVKESPFEIKPLAFYDPHTNLNYGLSLKYKF